MPQNRVPLPCGCAQPPLFDGTQSSLVFINTCFGIAFAGVFTLIQDYFQTTRPSGNVSNVGAHTSSALLTPTLAAANLQPPPAALPLDLMLSFLSALFSAGLATYLIVTVWRQYSTYYIPIQFHSAQQDPFPDEGTTVLITITLALIPIAASRSPTFTPYALICLICANLYKLRSIRSILRPLPAVTQATDELRHLARKLRFNLGCLVMVSLILYAEPFQITPRTFAILTSLAVLLLHGYVQVLYPTLYAFQPRPLLYTECVARAFHLSRCPYAPEAS